MKETVKSNLEYFINEDIMKATLKFSLPEEQHEFMIASKASSLAYVISELDSFLRSKAKYEGSLALSIL